MTESSLLRTERRGSQRFRVELPCYLAVRGRRENKLIGRTVDISRTGVLILWERYESLAEIPLPGSRACVELELPRLGIDTRYLRCTGTIVRVLAAKGQAPQVALAVAQLEVRGKARKPVERAQLLPTRVEELLM